MIALHNTLFSTLSKKKSMQKAEVPNNIYYTFDKKINPKFYRYCSRRKNNRLMQLFYYQTSAFCTFTIYDISTQQNRHWTFWRNKVAAGHFRTT